MYIYNIYNNYKHFQYNKERLYKTLFYDYYYLTKNNYLNYMVDIQLKILDIQSANPMKNSLYLKNDSDYLKKLWPGSSLTTISEIEVNSMKFLLKLGTNSIGEIPLIDFTKDWIHGSKEINGYRISLAYRILLKRSQQSNELAILQEKLKDSESSCKILSEKLKKYENNSDILELYQQALEKFKEKEKAINEKLSRCKEKKKSIKKNLSEVKNEKSSIESELFIVKEELQIEKLKAKNIINTNTNPNPNTIIVTPVEETDTILSESSFRFSFGPEGGSEDYEKNLECLLGEILEEKGIEQNILQVSAGVFYLGKVRAQIKIDDGEVLAYHKKAYIPINDFLEVHFQNKNPRRSLSAERFRPNYDTPNKLEKKLTNQPILNKSMKIVQDIDKVLEYSTLNKTKY